MIDRRKQVHLNISTFLIQSDSKTSDDNINRIARQQHNRQLASQTSQANSDSVFFVGVVSSWKKIIWIIIIIWYSWLLHEDKTQIIVLSFATLAQSLRTPIWDSARAVLGDPPRITQSTTIEVRQPYWISFIYIHIYWIIPNTLLYESIGLSQGYLLLMKAARLNDSKYGYAIILLRKYIYLRYDCPLSTINLSCHSFW